MDDGIATPKQAARILHGLLARVTPAATEAELRQVANELDHYDDPLSRYGVPHGPEYEFCRAMAQEVCAELRGTLAARALERMRGRTAALLGYIASIDDAASGARRDAKLINPEWITGVVRSATAALESAGAARRALGEGRHQDALAEFERILEHVEAIRGRAEALRGNAAGHG